MPNLWRDTILAAAESGSDCMCLMSPPLRRKYREALGRGREGLISGKPDITSHSGRWEPDGPCPSTRASMGPQRRQASLPPQQSSGRAVLPRHDVELLKPVEVASRLKVATVTVYKWAQRGLLPYYQLEGAIRIDEVDLLEFIKSRRVTEARPVKAKKRAPRPPRR